MEKIDAFILNQERIFTDKIKTGNLVTLSHAFISSKAPCQLTKYCQSVKNDVDYV